jgi:hypothetical protein
MAVRSVALRMALDVFGPTFAVLAAAVGLIAVVAPINSQVAELVRIPSIEFSRKLAESYNFSYRWIPIQLHVLKLIGRIGRAGATHWAAGEGQRKPEVEAGDTP